MRKRFFYYAFGSSRKERSDGTAIVRQRRNRVNDIIINEKKLTGDCRSAFYYLNLIRSLKLQRSKQYEELAEDVREFTLT